MSEIRILLFLIKGERIIALCWWLLFAVGIVYPVYLRILGGL